MKAVQLQSGLVVPKSAVEKPREDWSCEVLC